jgi:hypothetical protein
MKRCSDRRYFGLEDISSSEAEEDPSSRVGGFALKASDRAALERAFDPVLSGVRSEDYHSGLVASKAGVYLHGKRASA